MIFDYKCNKCGFVDEYIVSSGVPAEMAPPITCPECNDGDMEQQFSVSGINFDITGYSYENVYGKKNWKLGKTDSEISSYLTPDPETGRYKDPY